jgi:hypothetical protein
MTFDEQNDIIMRAAEAGHFSRALDVRAKGLTSGDGWDPLFRYVDEEATALLGEPFDLGARDYDSFRQRFWNFLLDYNPNTFGCDP